MSAFKPATDQMALMEKQLCLLLLYIARDSAWSPRFRQILGENGEYDVRAFSGADLQGNIDIRIDPASAWPKSPLMERQMLKEAFAMGLFPPPAQDPELAAKVARMLSLSHLKPSLGLDHKQVGRKLTRWKAATRPEEIAPPDPTTESLPVHHAMLSAFLKTEEFEELQGANPPVAQAMVQHVQMIGQLLAQQAAAQQAAAAPQGAGGEGAVLDAAVASGALQPAGAVPPPADPLDALMASGALQPAAATAEPGVSIDELAAARMVLPLSAEHTQPPTG